MSKGIHLKTLEEAIRPKPTSGTSPGDTIGMLLVLALTAALLLARHSDEQRYYNEVIGQMLSFHLLAALGFLLALRWGAIDLSVWVVAGLGGVVAAGAMRLGAGPAAGIALAVATGTAVGALHGLFVARLRLPSPLVTLVTSGLIVLLLHSMGAARAVSIPEGALDAWLAWLPDGQFAGDSPLMLNRPFILRMLLVGGAFLLVMMAVWAVCVLAYEGERPFRPATGLWASLMASGALAGLAGAIWLLDYGMAPVPTRLIGDLRIPAAALLAGTLLYRGHRRVLLAMLCLPAAVLATTLWQLILPLRPLWGYPLQMPLLIVATLVAHAIILRAAKRSHGTPISGVGDS